MESLMKRSDVCLVLTGCISPSRDVYLLEVKDSDIRKKQYIEALEFYIKEIDIEKIIFCDNSDFGEIEGIKEIALKYGKDFEWLNFKGDVQKTIEKGKGYGEGEILKYVCENSKIIQTCKYMVKVTGRLKIGNLNFILRIISNNKNYINIYLDRKKQYFADTRFFVMNIEDFKNYLKNEYERVNDHCGEYLEVCIAQKIMEADIQYSGFPVYIGYEGISGSTGLVYRLSVKEKIQVSMSLLLKEICNKGEKYRAMEQYSIGIVLDEDTWLKRFSEFINKRVAIYGAGILGKRWYKACIKYCDVVLWVDRDYRLIKRVFGEKIRSPKDINSFIVDYIVVAVSGLEIFMEIEKFLKGQDVQASIVWYNGYSIKNMDGNGENEL